MDDSARLWPSAADAEYVRARTELAAAEQRLTEQVEEVAALRRRLPAGAPMPPYRLTVGVCGDPEPPATAGLGDLFGGHEHLFVYHLMFGPDDAAACPMCSMWVDGLHGVSHHLTRRMSFAVLAKAPWERLEGWGRKRGWDKLRMVSTSGTTLNTDLAVEAPDGRQKPAVSVFRLADDTVEHCYTRTAGFEDGSDRGIDLLSPVWNVLDLLPVGRGDWFPSNSYAGRSRGESAAVTPAEDGVRR